MFDSGAFDPGAFDAEGGGGGGIGEPLATGTPAFGIAISVFLTGTPSFGLAVSVVDAAVADTTGQHALSWGVTVWVGAVNLSARLVGSISIQAAADAARIATLSAIPASPADLAGYENQPVTIDVTLARAGLAGTWRIFTGVVQGKEFDAASRVVELSCRDGYQERPKACASAAEVEALFGGLAFPQAKLVEWSAAEPDPVRYFSALLDTLQGCVAIDSNGLWQATPWTIGAPAASFGPGDIDHGSLRVIDPDRSAVPASVNARLNLRYPRLHAAELELTWDAVERVRYIVDGLPTLTKSMVVQALGGLGDWQVKGDPILTSPIPGVYPVIVGPQTVNYIVSHEIAPTLCESLSATLVRRWYQEVEVSYTVSIDMGGLSERDDAIAVTLQSEFAAADWESTPSTESLSGLYQANAPTPPTPPTGYEGLPEPFPTANTGLDWHPDVTTDDLTAACRHVVALAARRAALGKRQRGVRFARPIDPRWEIGSVLAAAAYGVTARGQVDELAHELDLDSGLALSTFRLACPAGAGTPTTITAAPGTYANTVAHALTAPPLGNPVGAAFETPAVPDEDLLTGFLCNVLPTSANYDASKPVYEPQFRIILPEIPAGVRDPLAIAAAIEATVALAGGDLTITF